MRLGLGQHIGMRQELRVNPRLYQAMDMLYMPMMELQQHLKQELLVNPFLELMEDDELPDETPATDQEKEKEQKQKDEEMDWEEVLLNGFDVGGTRAQHEVIEYTEPVTVEVRDLIDHLREQLSFLDLTARQLLLAEEFLGNIQEDGRLAATMEEILHSVNQWLITNATTADEEPDPDDVGLEDFGEQEPEPASAETAPAGMAALTIEPITETVAQGALQPAELVEDAVVTEAVEPPTPAPLVAPPGVELFTEANMDEMLAIIQRLDPPGVGSRDVRECLLLQLTDLKEVDTLQYRLVSEVFDDLKAHRWNDLAKRFGVEPVDVQGAADKLQRLDPKPGLKYSAGNEGYITPDLIVEKVDSAYHVFLNDTGVPRLRLSRSYQEIARDRKKMTKENREFIAAKLNSASWMIQAIEQRRQTMLKVMNFIVDRQREFFERGIEYLRPLTLREVAEVIDMHESTVSRVTNEKYVQTPRGVLPLKFFFSSALSTSTGEDASARSIRAKLQKMIGEEDSAKPLTDQQIVHKFQEQGIKIARRTVAKYRDQLGILPARMRKRV
ncbi:MAG: RNA polymerase factor sigma-54 [Gemmatimonadetes bacterium]|nr:MAG: RNA polymerase factor sigma-54 [Gemmatimonadota bacterium]